MKNILQYTLIIICSLVMLACSKSEGDSKIYTCTCNYKDLRTGKDTILSETYPSNTSQYTAQSRCDSNNLTVKVIDPDGACKL